MKEIDEGGSAFPNEGGPYSDLHACHGMTLRDYFAGQALASVSVGILANVDDKFCREKPTTAAQILANACYGMADAMIAERKKGT